MQNCVARRETPRGRFNFAMELARVPRGGRRFQRSDIDWETFSAKLAKGESAGSMVGQPGMPTKGEYDSRRRKGLLPDRPAEKEPDWEKFLELRSKGALTKNLFGNLDMPTHQQHRYRRKNNAAYRAAYFAITQSVPQKRAPRGPRPKGNSAGGCTYRDIFYQVIDGLKISKLGVTEVCRNIGISQARFVHAIRQDSLLYEQYISVLFASGRARRFSEAEYDLSLEAYGQYLGVAERFEAPAGCPRYNSMVARGIRDHGFAARFRAARLRRLRSLCENGVPGRQNGYLPGQYDAYLEAIRASNCRTKSEFKHQARVDIPTWWTAQNEAGRNPEYAERLQSALVAKGWEKGKRSAPTQARARRTIKPAKPLLPAGQLRGQLFFDELYSASYAAVSKRGLFENDRDDVISDMIEAVLRGSMHEDEIGGRAKEFVTAHNRRSETYKFRSLDQTVSEDSDTAFIDLVTADASGYGDYAD